MEEPGFWDNPDNSQKAMKELKHLKDTVEKYEGTIQFEVKDGEFTVYVRL